MSFQLTCAQFCFAILWHKAFAASGALQAPTFRQTGFRTTASGSSGTAAATAAQALASASVSSFAEHSLESFMSTMTTTSTPTPSTTYPERELQTTRCTFQYPELRPDKTFPYPELRPQMTFQEYSGFSLDPMTASRIRSLDNR